MSPKKYKQVSKTAAERRENQVAQYDFVTFEEKYGSCNFSFICPDKKRTKGEMWAAICEKVASNRDGQGYWYVNEKPEGAPRPPPVDPSAKIHTQKNQLEALERWERDQAYLANDLALWALVERLRAGDKEAAVELIESRSDHEYEGYTFQRFMKLD